MPLFKLQTQHIPTRYRRTQFRRFLSRTTFRNETERFSKSQTLPHPAEEGLDGYYEAHSQSGKEESGAMSRRLEEMTEKSVDGGGRSAQKAVEEAGFSDELRRKLEARIEDSKFRSEHAADFAQLNMPVRSARRSATHRLIAVHSHLPVRVLEMWQHLSLGEGLKLSRTPLFVCLMMHTSPCGKVVPGRYPLLEALLQASTYA